MVISRKEARGCFQEQKTLPLGPEKQVALSSWTARSKEKENTPQKGHGQGKAWVMEQQDGSGHLSELSVARKWEVGGYRWGV